jgi:hypothetical protein
VPVAGLVEGMDGGACGWLYALGPAGLVANAGGYCQYGYGMNGGLAIPIIGGGIIMGYGGGGNRG